MGKLSKIVEARAIVRDAGKDLDAKLSKVLTAKEIKGLEPEISLLRQAFKLVEIKLFSLEPKLKNKLSNLL